MKSIASLLLLLGLFIIISAISPNTNIALALSGPLIVPLMIFSGFLLNFE